MGNEVSSPSRRDSISSRRRSHIASSAKVSSPANVQHRLSIATASTAPLPTTTTATGQDDNERDLPPPPYSPHSDQPSTAPPASSEFLAPPSQSIRRSRSASTDIGISSPSTTSLAPPPSSSHRRSRSGSGMGLPAPGSAEADGWRIPRPPGANAGSRHTDVLISQAPPSTAFAGATNPFRTPQPTANQSAERGPPQRRNTSEDLLEMLKKFDTVLIVDDSSSMAGHRWAQTRTVLSELVAIAAQYDFDGIDVHFLNDPRVGRGVRTAQDVETLFDTVNPRGITPTGEKLEILLLDYILKIEEARDKDEGGLMGAAFKAIKPVNFVVLTDGAPTDDPESVILEAARRLDSQHFPLSQVGIQFVQIGHERGAAEALQELDDELSAQHGIRDMVDFTRYDGELTPRKLAKMLLGGVNRRIDRRGVQ